ncbi:DNA phosphorothioation system restriction enzyme [Leptolyngbya sp. KIOST-1]|uniref:DNA phosphorothioation system restriction enzyme n=1 Tax=Leptolyngbya sp. KIOST-1 TaxID=1229172 RepID=UPI0009DFD0E7|nr:DNA phosphorothioation system restriction enzyme [Leptolyngbya sp. KIOST-1]
MSLKDLTIQDEYRSSDRDIVQDFYIPCLEQATVYNRAVGYFSSSSMACVAQGLSAFVRSGGQMRLITSPQLSEEDVRAIEQGLKNREQVVEAALLRELEVELPQVVQDRLAALVWLLSRGLLEIKLAIPKTLRRRGIYHEKLGLFVDGEGHVVAFTGSANESASALIDNFECLDVFCSWDAGVRQRALQKARNFQDLWNDQTKHVEVMAFPQAVARSLLKLCPTQPPTQEPRVASGQGDYKIDDSLPTEMSRGDVPNLPPSITLRPYQQQAIANWFANKGRGTLKMATGSGKTITALAIAAALYDKIQLQALIVVCPYRHLVTQWTRECRKFGLEPILAYENVRQWQDRLSSQLYSVRSGYQPFVTVLTTNATLMGDGLQSQLPYFPEKTLIVGDEAHNLGAKRLEQSLPRTVGLRLALSATPERYFDEAGTEGIFNYFGPVLEPEFTLADAIAQGALVHYRYYPVLVELTEEEAQRYAALTQKIGQLASMGDSELEEKLKGLLNQRSRLVGNAANKLQALRSLMGDRLDTSHTLFYCGDGSVEDEVSQENYRYVEAVTVLLGKELGYRVNTYTADTSLEEREDLRRQFETGELQGLVAIRCLDEGVDIPATQTAVIMASSGNPRQFVQRRGRVLRRAPGKDRATLFDMIVVPPALEGESLAVERGLLKKELRRFVEFAHLADNAGEARVQLLDLQKRYGLLDM